MATEIDPSLYALQLQLQLDSSKALDSLEDFSTTITDFEQRITVAAQDSLGTTTKSISSIDNAFSQISNSLRSIASSLYENNTSLTKSTENALSMYDVSTDYLDSAKKVYQQESKTLDQREDLGKTLKDQIDNANEFLDSTKEISKAVQIKNAGHVEQNQLVREGANDIGHQVANVGDLNDQYRVSTRHLHNIYSRVRQILSALLSVDKATEEFVTHNFRAYGSQYLLLRSSYELSESYGILQERAIEIYKVLGNLRAPQTEIKKLAGVVGIANRTTGVGVQILGQFAVRLNRIGMASANIETQIARTTEAMRRFGLNTEDIQSLLSSTTDLSFEIAALFGGGSEAGRAKAIADWNDWTVSVAGFGKELGGVSADKLNESFRWLATDVGKMALFQMYTGQAVRSTDDLTLATMKAAKRASEELDMIERNAAGNLAQIDVQRKTLAERSGMNIQMLETLRLMDREAKARGNSFDSLADYKKLVGDLTANQMDQFAKSNDTLTKQWDILTGHFRNAGAALYSLGAEGLKDFLKYVNTALQYVSMFIVKMSQLVDVVGEFNPGLATAIRWIAGFVAAIGTIGVAVFGLRAALVWFRSMVLDIFSTLGRGIYILGNRIRTVMVPILALSASIFLIAAGALMFAYAVQILANTGQNGVIALVALSAVIALAIVGLLAAGTAATAIAPGLLALSATLISVGIAAILLAKAFDIVVGCIIDMSKSMPELVEAFSIGNVASLLLGLTALTLGLTAWAAASLPVAAAVTIAGTALWAAGKVVSWSANSFKQIGETMKAGVTDMSGSLALLSKFSSDLDKITAGLKNITAIPDLLRNVSEGIAEADTGLRNSISSIYESISLIPKLFGYLNAVAAGISGSVLADNVAKMVQSLADCVPKIEVAMSQIESSVISRDGTEMANGLVNIGNNLNDASHSLSITMRSVALNIVSAAADLDRSVTIFEKPVNRLLAVLTNLGESITNLGDNIALSDHMAKVSDMLDKYASVIESGASRIESAIAVKAASAIQLAKESGGPNAVRAETISRVNVVMEREGGENESDSPDVVIRDLLISLDTKLSGLVVNKGLAEIISILAQYLPKLDERGSVLSSELSSWG